MQISEITESLLKRIRRDGATAALSVWRRSREGLARLAARRLHPLVRRKVEPEDVLQSVYESFFRRVEDGDFQLDSPAGLMGLLRAITSRKCLNYNEFYLSAQRDVRREIPSGAPLPATSGWNQAHTAPEEDILAAEMLANVLSGLDQRCERILILHLEGRNDDEIASELGCSRRTVRRLFDQFRHCLEEGLKRAPSEAS